MDSRIEANNLRGKVLQGRAQKYNDAVDEWKADCANKPYDVSAEIAVQKEHAEGTQGRRIGPHRARAGQP